MRNSNFYLQFILAVTLALTTVIAHSNQDTTNHSTKNSLICSNQLQHLESCVDISIKTTYPKFGKVKIGIHGENGDIFMKKLLLVITNSNGRVVKRTRRHNLRLRLLAGTYTAQVNIYNKTLNQEFIVKEDRITTIQLQMNGENKVHYASENKSKYRYELIYKYGMQPRLSRSRYRY